MTRLDDAERRRHKGEQIEQQIGRIAILVDTLLLMAKLESGEAFNHLPVNLDYLLEAECQRVVNSHSTRPRLHCQIQPNLPPVNGDAEYLAYALDQLLDNACRFTPPDGSVTIAAGATEDQVWVEIDDTGIGITEDDLPHIFETFWRHDDAHTTPGFGLGLPIAQRIVEHHGGTISVQSRVGHGSSFRVMLPATPTA
jgi:signal transduction histidine kinase